MGREGDEGREALLAERLRQLEERARFYRWASIASILAVLTGGLLLEEDPRAYAAAAAGYLLAALMAARAYTLTNLVDRKWDGVLKWDPRDARIDALTLIAAATIALIAVIVARLLGG